VVAAMILGSSVAGIDSTVVAVALPAIGRNLHAGFQGLQWTVTSYTLTLASLILLAGSLSDRWGRRRVFLAGLAGLASGVNNAVARVAGLLWIAALPPLTGLTGAAYTHPMQFRSSFAQISWICAAAFACAAVLAATLITGPGRPFPARRPALIQTPVPHLACPVAFRHTPRQTRRPNGSQTSHPSCATDTPSSSRPRIDHAQEQA
jgi:MFS family permease